MDHRAPRASGPGKGAHPPHRRASAGSAETFPWVRLEKAYAFQGADGEIGLADLFQGRSQLIVYHFMYGPDMKEACPSCSFVADHFDATLPHLGARDVALAAVSRAPYPKLEAFKRRMGWRFPWVSSSDTDFNFAFGVSSTEQQREPGLQLYNFGTSEFLMPEREGASVFARQEGEIFHTYSTYGRGRGGADGHVQLPRPGSQGPGRGRARLHDGVGALPRSLPGLSR